MKLTRLPDPQPSRLDAAGEDPARPRADQRAPALCHVALLQVLGTLAVLALAGVAFFATPTGHGPFDPIVAKMTSPVSRTVAGLAVGLVVVMWVWGPRLSWKALGASLVVVAVGVGGTVLSFGVLFAKQPLLALAAYFLVVSPLMAWTSRKIGCSDEVPEELPVLRRSLVRDDSDSRADRGPDPF